MTPRFPLPLGAPQFQEADTDARVAELLDAMATPENQPAIVREYKDRSARVVRELSGGGPDRRRPIFRLTISDRNAKQGDVLEMLRQLESIDYEFRSIEITRDLRGLPLAITYVGVLRGVAFAGSERT